ncbi:hypothetical protein B0T22DRAFT_476673 [Podospora appendiculata]|uniref:Uncharacterized protein n=1 Tax=Podospora appendiculata TaxID=314037 RepID=A0AAE0XI37_9PEZI|nr:hypothetical protein B0T22DRAFT_476673 [Podospora appendiculata]
MRIRQTTIPGSGLLVPLCLVLAGLAHFAVANPYPRDELQRAGYGYLVPRQCAQPCGYGNRYCCSAGSTCYTSADIAGCSVGGAGGGYAFYTTTWTLTETFTSTFSSVWPAATTIAGQNCVPPEGSGQIACGSICCASWQYCANLGQCMANGVGGGSAFPSGVSSGGQSITTGFIAPYRPTSVVTETGTAASSTATSTGIVVGGTASSSLSPGAIAGIVIGSLAGVALLLLLCACCVVRGLWHGVMALLGLGGARKKKSETVVVEEERYTRRGSTHSRRDAHGSWYAGGGRPSTESGRKEKKSSGTGLLGLGAALGTLWLLLGLKKKDKKKSKPVRARSDISSNYYSDSYTAESPTPIDAPAGQGKVAPVE